MDTVADYELREMADGFGMKRISQSFKEKAVGVILEEDEAAHSDHAHQRRGDVEEEQSAPRRHRRGSKIDSVSRSGGSAMPKDSLPTAMAALAMRNAHSVSATDRNASPSPDPTMTQRGTPSQQMPRRRGHRKVSSLGLPSQLGLAQSLVRALVCCAVPWL